MAHLKIARSSFLVSCEVVANRPKLAIVFKLKAKHEILILLTYYDVINKPFSHRLTPKLPHHFHRSQVLPPNDHTPPQLSHRYYHLMSIPPPPSIGHRYYHLETIPPQLGHRYYHLVTTQSSLTVYVIYVFMPEACVFLAVLVRQITSF